MEKDKEMLLAGDPEFEISQVEDQMRRYEESPSMTYELGQVFTIICCG